MVESKICGKCNELKPASEFTKNSAKKSGLQHWCKKCFKKHTIIDIKNRQAYEREVYRNQPQKNLWEAAKGRAKKKKLPFNISIEDIIIPDICPILGIPLQINSKQSRDTSMSLDRVIPEKGYVRGNICVISHRANTLKHDGTLDEMRAIVRYLEKFAEHT